MTRPGALESRVAASSSWTERVDAAWEDFVASLPTVMQDDARALPLVLRLTPRPLPWSRIFHQEVTLALPLTLSEALPHATPVQVETAVRAHMFGIIAAFGADRLDDGQVEPTPRLLQLLDDVRFVRDSAIDAFGTATPTPTYDFRAADVATAQANRLEQDFLARNASADFGTYERLSVGKQWLVFPAAMTFARACGFSDAQLQQLETMCLAMAMGLQLRDDATDWEDDHAEGRAWAVRLLRHAEGAHDRDARDDVNTLRARMAETGVVVTLLHGAVRHFETARDAALALGAHRIAAWSDKNAQLTRTLADDEGTAPGHIVRWERARKSARA